nr:DUF3293 domain-containing protein [uncultured Glaciecola sp.]
MDKTSMLDNETVEIYKAAKYIVLTDNTLCRITVGKGCADIDALLLKHNAQAAYFITPENPFSVVLTSAENTLRHKRFRQELSKAKYPFYEGYGTNEDETWPKENSYLIMCDGESKMHKLAGRYGQNAFLKVNLRSSVILLALDSMNYKSAV